MISCRLQLVVLRSLVAFFGLAATLSAQEAPKKVALLVGVNQYDKPIFSQLSYAERDVDDVGAELRRLGFDVTVLKGSAKDKERATRQNIVDTLGRLVEPLGTNDVMIVMLSGHGQQFETTRADGTRHDDAYYCPVDAVSNKPETLVSMSYVVDDVLAPNVGRKLVLVDACRDAPKDPGRGSRGIQGRVIALPEDTAVLFSCRAGQQSWENDDLQHGLFSYCVLEALKGQGAREQEVSWTDMVAYVNRRMAAQEMRDLMPRPQDPIPAGGVPYTVLGRIGSNLPIVPDPIKPPSDHPEPPATIRLLAVALTNSATDPKHAVTIRVGQDAKGELKGGASGRVVIPSPYSFEYWTGSKWESVTVVEPRTDMHFAISRATGGAPTWVHTANDGGPAGPPVEVPLAEARPKLEFDEPVLPADGTPTTPEKSKPGSRIVLTSLVCRTPEDDASDGDEAVLTITVDGRNYKNYSKQMRSGSTWTLNETITFQSDVRVTLVDDDSGDLIGGNDNLGTVRITPNQLTGSGSFTNYGANYTLSWEAAKAQ